jgi:hypothetical protein
MNKVKRTLVVCALFVAFKSNAQIVKNSYSIGFTGVVQSAAANDKMILNSNNRLTNLNGNFNFNYYFSNHFYATALFSVNRLYQKNLYSGVQNSTYSHHNSLLNNNIFGGGLGIGYYKMLGSKVLFTGQITYEYATGKNTNMNASIDTNLTYYNHYKSNYNYTGNLTSHSVYIKPSIHYLLNKRFSLSVTLNNFGYQYSTNKGSENRSYSNSYMNKSTVYNSESIYVNNFSYTRNNFNYTLRFSDLNFGINYFFGGKKGE